MRSQNLEIGSALTAHADGGQVGFFAWRRLATASYHKPRHDHKAGCCSAGTAQKLPTGQSGRGILHILSRFSRLAGARLVIINYVPDGLVQKSPIMYRSNGTLIGWELAAKKDGVQAWIMAQKRGLRAHSLFATALGRRKGSADF